MEQPFRLHFKIFELFCNVMYKYGGPRQVEVPVNSEEIRHVATNNNTKVMPTQIIF